MHYPQQHSAELLMQQFLRWIAAAPRPYAEVMEGWRSSCPRLSIWDDAVAEGLVRIEGSGRMAEACVMLSERGMAMLQPVAA